jgi:hypothetical protein
MLRDLGDVDMLVGSLKNMNNVAGFERYICQADEVDGLQKIPGAGLLSPSCDRTEDSISPCANGIWPSRDRVDGYAFKFWSASRLF